MQITEVKIKKVYNDATRPVKAKVSVTIDNEMVLHNIKVIEAISNGVRKRFLSFPSQKVTTLDENNEPIHGHFDLYHPTTNDCRIKFETAVYKALDAYNKKLNEEKEKETK